MKLWCERCHTLWTEQCFGPGDRCPFKDCTGRLSITPPKSIKKRTRAKRDKTLPLLERACE